MGPVSKGNAHKVPPLFESSVMIGTAGNFIIRKGYTVLGKDMVFWIPDELFIVGSDSIMAVSAEMSVHDLTLPLN